MEIWSSSPFLNVGTSNVGQLWEMDFAWLGFQIVTIAIDFFVELEAIYI